MEEINQIKYYLASDDGQFIGIDGIDSIVLIPNIEHAISYSDRTDAEKILDICKEHMLDVKIYRTNIHYTFFEE